MPPWSQLFERPRPGLILISRCKTLASARGFRGSVSCSFIPSCLAGDSGGGFCESRFPAALGGTSERRPHPSRPFRIPFVLSIFFSTWWSPVSGARGDDERRQRLFRLISLLLRFENCGPLFYQPRVHSLGRQRAARAARCDCARHVVSTPVFLGRGGEGGAKELPVFSPSSHFVFSLSSSPDFLLPSDDAEIGGGEDEITAGSGEQRQSTRGAKFFGDECTTMAMRWVFG